MSRAKTKKPARDTTVLPARPISSPSLRQLREDHERLRLQIEIQRLEHTNRMLGFRGQTAQLVAPTAAGRPISLQQAVDVLRQNLLETAQVPDWVGSYVDLLDRYRDGQNLLTPITTPNDRRYGRNFPLWQTEQELNLLRAPARVLCATNTYAQGLLRGLRCFVINTGYTVRAVPKPGCDVPKAELDRVHAILEEFDDRSDWGEWEREFFWRSREDGDAFLRTFLTDDGVTEVRSVEPEQILQPPNTDLKDWSFGIRTDPEDVQTPLEYWVADLYDLPNGEEVDAGEIIHFKANTKRSIKRGCTDFAFSAYDALNIADKLRRNMGEGAAVREAIAGVREHQTASIGQVTTFQQAQVDYTRSDPVTGRSTDYAKVQPGTILDMDANTQWKPGPTSADATASVQILDALCRGAAAKWNAPEWLVSSNAQNMGAYTSSLVAESPFVIGVQTEQQKYVRSYKRMKMTVLQNAVKAGKLSQRVLDRINLQVEAPSPVHRDQLAEAQGNIIRVQGGWKSRQSVAQEEGLDWDQEQTNIEEYNERTGGAGLPLQMPGGQDLHTPGDEGGYTKLAKENVGAGADPSGLANTSGWTPNAGRVGRQRKKPARRRGVSEGRQPGNRSRGKPKKGKRVA